MYIYGPHILLTAVSLASRCISISLHSSTGFRYVLHIFGNDVPPVIDSGCLEGYHESRRCSRDTFPESYITKYENIQR